MLVHAFIASVRTAPEPTVFPHFDRFDEVLADFVGGGFGIAVFAEDDLAQFFYYLWSASPSLTNSQAIAKMVIESDSWENIAGYTFIPIGHIVLLPLFLLLLFLRIPGILVQVPLFALPLNRKIMTKLAFPTLVTISLLIKLT